MGGAAGGSRGRLPASAREFRGLRPLEAAQSGNVIDEGHSMGRKRWPTSGQHGFYVRGAHGLPQGLGGRGRDNAKAVPQGPGPRCHASCLGQCGIPRRNARDSTRAAEMP